MRARAERRLGPSFDKLLGETHTYDHITRDLLTDYISAGDDMPAGVPTQRMCYSDVTRTAELFFSQGPFAFPITLIDTPGTNDPFLVRDEITRRSLENPDIFIFVISALQPLTSADIAMLRLINGLHKDRILVFINRADQLADPVHDGAIIKGRVEQRLKDEFPALSIPVVLGSAVWANLGLQGQALDARAVAPILTPQLLAANALPVQPGLATSNNSPNDRAFAAHALYVAAGLPKVAAALDHMIETSTSAGPPQSRIELPLGAGTRQGSRAPHGIAIAQRFAPIAPSRHRCVPGKSPTRTADFGHAGPIAPPISIPSSTRSKAIWARSLRAI